MPKLWELEKNCKEVGKTKSIIMKKPKDNHIQDPKARYFYISEHNELAPIYTKPDSGQEKYGGWTEKGVRRYKKVLTTIKQIRGTPEAIAWEKKLLDELRKANNIEGKTWEEQRRLRGKRPVSTAKSAARITSEELFDDEDLEPEFDADFGDFDPDADEDDQAEPDE